MGSAPWNYRFFKSALDATPVNVTIVDAQDKGRPLIYVNPAFERTTGYGSDQVVGRNCSFLQGPDTDRDTVDAMRRALDAGEEVSVEILNYRRDGTPFWNDLRISPVHDENGGLVAFVGFQVDVTDRKAAEAAVTQARKLEALGRVTGGIAHEINNMLQPMLAFPELISYALPEDAVEERQWLKDVEDHARAARGIVGSVLEYARPANERIVQTLDVATEVRRALADARHRAASNIRIEVSGALTRDEPFGQISGAPGSLTRSLVNLLWNAIDVLPEGGTIVVHAEVVDDELFFKVSDNGPGVPKELLESIFEPFFTTKPIGLGTGLGLALVDAYVRHLNGTIELQNAPDGGAVFSITLPLGSAGEGPVTHAPHTLEGTHQWPKS